MKMAQRLILGSIVTCAMGAFGVGCGAPADDEAAVASDASEEALDADSERELLVEYDINSPCTMFINYPKDGVTGNSDTGHWTMTGKKIIWRYNVNGDWALVSDPVRARAKTYPWWGFTLRGCIKGEPDLIMKGRTRNLKDFPSGFRPVDFSVAHAAITDAHHATHSNATLRDPVNFVIGNVPDGWHVDVTGHTRSSGHWVEVYVPNAKRWGYVEADKLQ